jgi:hypothetical protein
MAEHLCFDFPTTESRKTLATILTATPLTLPEFYTHPNHSKGLASSLNSFQQLS